MALAGASDGPAGQVGTSSHRGRCRGLSMAGGGGICPRPPAVSPAPPPAGLRHPPPEGLGVQGPVWNHAHVSPTPRPMFVPTAARGWHGPPAASPLRASAAWRHLPLRQWAHSCHVLPTAQEPPSARKDMLYGTSITGNDARSLPSFHCNGVMRHICVAASKLFSCNKNPRGEPATRGLQEGCA